MELTEQELQAISLLIQATRAAYLALEDAEELDEGEYLVPHGAAHDLILALDELDELSDDHPECQLSPAGKAEWALRRLLGIKE